SVPFSFPHPPPTYAYTLSLHDALPILRPDPRPLRRAGGAFPRAVPSHWCRRDLGAWLWAEQSPGRGNRLGAYVPGPPQARRGHRSEEHTSELQSRGHLVCRLLLEKKKK